MIGHRHYRHLLAIRPLLPSSEETRLTTHLASCRSCHQRAAVYARQDDGLRRMLGHDGPATSVLPTVLAAVDSGRPSAQRESRGAWTSRLPRSSGALALTVLLVLVVLSTVAYAAGAIIHVYRPERPHSRSELQRLFWTPMLPPYGSVRYRALGPARAAAESGYAVAYLRTPPLSLRASVGVDILPHVGWPPPPPGSPVSRVPGPELAVAIRSVVRYRGGGHTVIVLLNEPSPGAIRTRELVLGQHTVRLPNGQDGWTSPDVSASAPYVRPRSGPAHELAWVSGGYVVSLWSDLPEAQLIRLAGMTVVGPPRPSHRGIPSTWPTPQPPERLPSQLQAVVDATAVYQEHGSRLTVRYMVQFGSYSQGALYGLDKWKDIDVALVFPKLLRSRATEPLPHHTFPGGSGGVGGDITFSTSGLSPSELARVLRAGVTVRLTRLEHGKRRRQLFHIALTRGSVHP